MVVFIAPSRL